MLSRKIWPPPQFGPPPGPKTSVEFGPPGPNTTATACSIWTPLKRMAPHGLFTMSEVTGPPCQYQGKYILPDDLAIKVGLQNKKCMD